YPDRVLVVHVEITRRRRWQNHSLQKLRVGEELLVSVSISTSAFGPLIEGLQLHVEDGCLQRIKTSVDCHCLMQIAQPTAMDPKHRQQPRKPANHRDDNPPAPEPATG